MLTEKDYCDYDTCVALKELGYIGYSKYFYTAKEPKKLQQNGELYFTIRTATACGYVLAIHLWDAQKWLRAKKLLHIVIDKLLYGAYEFSIVDILNYSKQKNGTANSYEEALLEGIKEAVKLLKEENDERDFS